MNSDYVISIISTIGDVKKVYKLTDIMKENASLLPLYYSDVRPQQNFKTFELYLNF